MTNTEMFYQKNGRTVRNISRDVLCLSEGEVLPSIAAYTEKFAVSRWTIQQAVQFLLENGCLRIEKHGPKGTTVYDIDRKKLWDYAEWNTLFGMAPIPCTPIHDSLYTGLAKAFARTDLPINLGYLSPALERCRSLERGRCHFILTSKLAADILRKQYDFISEPLILRGAVFSAPYRLYGLPGRKPQIGNGTRIGIHKGAIEQTCIGQALCEGRQVLERYSNYHGCLDLLARGEIDVLVQRSDIAKYPLGEYPYREIEETGEVRDACIPAIVCNRRDYGVEKLLRRFLRIQTVAAVQREVECGLRLPDYY